MLVRDIELVPAIIDLVDNSVDGAKRLRRVDGADRYAGLSIDIVASGTEFEIRDNCGGIDLDWARKYAFRFGRPEDIDGPLGEVGQFGVGMKRALFKLGRSFSVTSQTTTNAFTLPVDVDKWMADQAPDWSFELSDVSEQDATPEDDTGTLVQVRDLYPAISRELGSDSFANRLRADLRMRQAEVTAQGMRISVNGIVVESFTPELLVGDEFAPIARHETITIGSESLEMRLYAGFVRLRDEDDERDDDDAEDFKQPPDAGWYLFCNDRLLIAADRGRLTGWGTAAAAYHPQYRQFRGYVFLDGPSRLMPWTTTKTSVDEDHEVFRRIQTEMFDALTKTQAAINRVKKERQSNAEGARPAFDAVKTASARPLAALNWSSTITLPKPAPRRQQSDVRWIRYSVDPEQFAAVAGELGVTAPLDVGRGTFDFYLEHQVPD